MATFEESTKQADGLVDRGRRGSTLICALIPSLNVYLIFLSIDITELPAVKTQELSKVHQRFFLLYNPTGTVFWIGGTFRTNIYGSI